MQEWKSPEKIIERDWTTWSVRLHCCRMLLETFNFLATLLPRRQLILVYQMRNYNKLPQLCTTSWRFQRPIESGKTSLEAKPCNSVKRAQFVSLQSVSIDHSIWHSCILRDGNIHFIPRKLVFGSPSAGSYKGYSSHSVSFCLIFEAQIIYRSNYFWLRIAWEPCWPIKW